MPACYNLSERTFRYFLSPLRALPVPAIAVAESVLLGVCIISHSLEALRKAIVVLQGKCIKNRFVVREGVCVTSSYCVQRPMVKESEQDVGQNASEVTG